MEPEVAAVLDSPKRLREFHVASSASSSRSIAPQKSATALLILDMVSDFRFPDANALFRAAYPVARRIARLKLRASASGVPVIYVNDNFGRWKSDLPGMVDYCAQASPQAGQILRVLAPGDSDHCVLKPRHSGFYATALDTLLEYIGATRLVITGVSGNQCILFTANDAYVRDYQLHIPRDCIASPTEKGTQFALQYFKTVLDADLRPSTSLKFRRSRSVA